MFNFIRPFPKKLAVAAARCTRKFSSLAEDEPTKMEQFVKKLPLIGIFIGSVALTFQLTVLYPWHDELSAQFDELQVRI